jgi:hypothetical protein
MYPAAPELVVTAMNPAACEEVKAMLEFAVLIADDTNVPC